MIAEGLLLPLAALPHLMCHHKPIMRVRTHTHTHTYTHVQSKTGTEAMSVSTDGMVLWWDIRKLNEQVESMPLKEKGGEAAMGGVVLEYDPAAGPTNFMVGTEQVSRGGWHGEGGDACVIV